MYGVPLQHTRLRASVVAMHGVVDDAAGGRGARMSAGRAHLGAGLVYGHDGGAALPGQVLDGADAEERGRRVQACRYGSSYIDTLHRCVVSTGGMEVRVSGTMHARPGFAAAGATQSALARCR